VAARPRRFVPGATVRRAARRRRRFFVFLNECCFLLFIIINKSKQQITNHKSIVGEGCVIIFVCDRSTGS
jgi:hypothetical protein